MRRVTVDLDSAEQQKDRQRIREASIAEMLEAKWRYQSFVEETGSRTGEAV
jgi:hypothetical protein